MKQDLIRLFGVEGLVTPKTLLNETHDDVEGKTPYQISLDTKQLVDIMNDFITSGNIDGALVAISALALRIQMLEEAAVGIQQFIKRNGEEGQHG